MKGKKNIKNVFLDFIAPESEQNLHHSLSSYLKKIAFHRKKFIIQVTNVKKLSIQMTISDITCDFWLPSIAIKEQFFFIIEKFFVGFCRIFKIGSLDYGIDGAGLLAIPTEDTFREIDVIARGSPSAIASHFCLDCDSLCRARRLAKLASDASLLT